MKLELKNSPNGIDLSKLSKKLGEFIGNKERYVLFLAVAIFFGYCGYLWYTYVYNYQWNDAEKQAYISTKKSSVAFDRENFEKVLDEIKARQSEYDETIENQRDIFDVK